MDGTAGLLLMSVSQHDVMQTFPFASPPTPALLLLLLLLSFHFILVQLRVLFVLSATEIRATNRQLLTEAHSSYSSKTTTAVSAQCVCAHVQQWHNLWKEPEGESIAEHR